MQKLYGEFKMNGGELDTLVALIVRGPLEDGDVPSKSGRNDLVNKGLATYVVVNGKSVVAATEKGGEEFCKVFGNTNTVEEGIAHYRSGQAISRAKRRK